jgi:hypothetical protein
MTTSHAAIMLRNLADKLDQNGIPLDLECEVSIHNVSHEKSLIACLKLMLPGPIERRGRIYTNGTVTAFLTDDFFQEFNKDLPEIADLVEAASAAPATTSAV